MSKESGGREENDIRGNERSTEPESAGGESKYMRKEARGGRERNTRGNMRI